MMKGLKIFCSFLCNFLWIFRYTYLGNELNSLKNFHLQNEDGTYKPACVCPGIFENDSRGLKSSESLEIEAVPIVLIYFIRKSPDFADKVNIFFHELIKKSIDLVRTNHEKSQRKQTRNQGNPDFSFRKRIH